MTNLIGQDAKEAHRLLIRGRVEIILEMEVVMTYNLNSLVVQSQSSTRLSHGTLQVDSSKLQYFHLLSLLLYP